MLKIIFVCHGNICRSPAAQFIFNKLIKDQKLEDKFECYSRALSDEEIGNDIYPPMKIALDKAKIPYSSHKARRLDDLDIAWADYIIYMDDENKYLIDNFYQIDAKKLLNLASFLKKSEISDPWYHRGFEGTLKQIFDATNSLLNSLKSISETK